MSATIGYRDQVGVPNMKGRGPLRDIRKFIAQTQLPQMDPNNFPRPDYQRYPLMPLTKDKKPYYDDAGRTIVLHDAEDEDYFYKDHPEAIRVRDPEDTETELRRLREQVAAFEANDADKTEPLPIPPGSHKGAVAEDPAPEGDDNELAAITRPAPPKAPPNTAKTKTPAAPKPGSKLD